MSDLISRSALVKCMSERWRTLVALNGEYDHYTAGFDDAISYVDDAPAVDAVPVVHAKWVKAHGMMPPEYHHRKQCSMCGGWALQDYFGRERLSHYCPNCGAKMDAKEET